MSINLQSTCGKKTHHNSILTCTPRGKVSYSKSCSQAVTELVFSECIKGQKWGLRMGQNSPLGAKTQRLQEWWLGVEPEHSRRTACVKSEAVQAWSAFQASIRACETTSPRTWPPVVPQKGWVSLLYTGSSVPIRHP